MSEITKDLLVKVPAITLGFWIIKILCTTVGETFADYLNTTLNLGLNGTSIIMGGLLIIVLFFQFRSRKYTPSIYWLSVVLISVVGTLITDNVTNTFGISLGVSTLIFSLALANIFGFWYLKEKTLSIHTIHTKRRETFYWLAILFTFALGTSLGDLFAEQLALGYLNSAFIFAGVIGGITAIHYNFKFKLNPILTFWIAYILTRPLGASIGDYLSQNTADGGLGLGTTLTSGIFLTLILLLVLYLTKSKDDVIQNVVQSSHFLHNQFTYFTLLLTNKIIYILLWKKKYKKCGTTKM